MKQYLSWRRGRRHQGNGVESLCLYVAQFNPSVGVESVRSPIECATVETLVQCLNANPDVAAEVWRCLAESQGLKDTLSMRAERAEALAARGEHEGHDEPCYYCNLPCNNYAGNPGLWSLGFAHADEPGVVKWHHVGCVKSRLVERDAAMRALGYTIEKPADIEHVIKMQVDAQTAHLEKERDDYKLAADTWQADALRDGAALEKVRKLLGTTVVAEAVPTVLESVLLSIGTGARVIVNSTDPRPLCVTCGKPWVPPEGVDATVRPCAMCLVTGGDHCSYTFNVDDKTTCRRKAGHSGPHTWSLNEARALDAWAAFARAVVTHEDLRKLKDEIWDELIAAFDEVVVDSPHHGFGGVVERPEGFRELVQILKEKRAGGR